MALCTLRKIHFFTFPQYRDQLVHILQECGSVHLIDAESPGPNGHDSYFVSDAQNTASHVSGLENQTADLRRVIEDLSKYRDSQGLFAKLLPEKQPVSSEEFRNLSPQCISDLLEQIRGLDIHAQEIKRRIEETRELILQLQLLEGIEIPLECITDTRETFIRIGLLPVRNLEWMLSRIVDTLGEESEVEVLAKARGQAVTLIIGRLSLKEPFLSWMEKERLTLVPLFRLTGSPRENILRLRNEITQLDEQIALIQQNRMLLAGQLPQLQKVYDYQTNELQRFKTQTLLRKSKYTVTISGWIHQEDEPVILSQVEERNLPIATVCEQPAPDDSPPVDYQNPSVVQPFEFITDFYSRPRYHEIDPTPYTSLFFILFFGICLTDAGYGILVTLLAYFILRKAKSLTGSSAQLLRILFFSGMATTLVGLFTGGFFGFSFPQFPAPLDRLQHIVLLNPQENQLGFMVLTLGLGILHVGFGIFLKFRWNLKQGRIADAWLDQAPWLGILLGIVALASAQVVPILWMNTFGYLLLGVAAGMVLLFAGRSAKNPFIRIGKGMFSLYQISGLFGDILSYVRLFALGLATGVIAGVVNFLAGLALGIPFLGYVLVPIIFIGGHSLNIAINALGGFIHTTRLHFVEFFGKFFEGGGEPFQPFKLDLTYTTIREKESL
ncbi:MAG: V-type ATPase 116kDa subunit family protein [Calditrichota bacterium]